MFGAEVVIEPVVVEPVAAFVAEDVVTLVVLEAIVDLVVAVDLVVPEAPESVADVAPDVVELLF